MEKLSTITDKEYVDSDNFTLNERETIKLALNEIKGLINERFATTDYHIEVIDSRIKYLTEGVDRLNKTDWKGIFINTIISLTIALSLDAEKGQELYNLFVQFIQVMPLIGK